MTEGNGTKPNQKAMTIIVTKGSLDWAYPPFILATTAAAMGVDTTMFFTFYGLPLLLKKLDLKISPMGNPAMKMPMAACTWECRTGFPRSPAWTRRQPA